ncbi:Clp protease N-terminal domain-containing protein [Egicoccus halophilus]|uniref:Clp R domain-containing protein n=1 Tax=Egicoccus halophilus TaxID=1670830 RepID=A0A8J3A6D2_9ACTN|nr:Clp protease N-terminal domain-containing protein [Egicoccus halophilus]GGI04171.1 hypothetical protein GCM10011354_07730 [Egicoccus halophilus]
MPPPHDVDDHPGPSPWGGPVSLEALLDGIERASSDPLAQVTSAALAAQHLQALADRLLDHVVLRARDHGASWRDIGDRLGVSRQAAQQRFAHANIDPPRDTTLGFEQYTLEARNAVLAAHESALAHHHDRVTSKHLLLGLLDTGAAAALAAVGGDLALLRDVVRASLPGPVDAAPELVPYDEDATRALAAALERAGTRPVGTDAVLRELLRDDEVRGLLADAGLDVVQDPGASDR